MRYPANHTENFTLKLLAFFVLISINQSAWAFAAPLQSLSLPLFNTLIGVVGVLILALLILLLLARKKTRVREQSLADLANQSEKAQETVDRYISGVVHLDADGNILYANQMAMYFLVKKNKELVGSSFVNVCPSDVKNSVIEALKGTKETQIQCLLAYRKRHVRLRIAPLKNPIDQTFTLIAMEDIDSYQQQIDTYLNLNQHQQDAVLNANIGTANLDLTEGTMMVNASFGQLLNQEADISLPLSVLSDKISENSVSDWERALKHLSEGQTSQITLDLRLNEQNVPITLYAQPYQEGIDQDITAATLIVENRSQIELHKHQSSRLESQLKALVAASPLPIYILDAKNQLADCNRAFSALFKTDIRQIKGKSVDALTCFNDDYKALHKNVGGIGTQHKPITISSDDNQNHDLILHLLAYSNVGSESGTVVFIEDRTSLKALEQAVQVKTDMLENTIDQSPLGIAVFDDEDQLIQVNPSLTNILNVEQKTLVSQTFFQLFKNPEQSGTASRLLHRNGLIDNFSAELICGDEETIQTRIDVSKLPGDTNHYVCWVTDARAQTYLSHQLERLITYSSMPVAILGIEGFTQLNPAACAFFDIKNEEALLGLTPASLALNTNDEQADTMAGHLAHLYANKQVNAFPWVHQHDGEQLPCEITLVPLFEQRQHVATLCMWVDLRVIEQANAARLEAVNLRQAAEREIAEKQQLLESSQDLLASRARSLEDTQQKLHAAEDDLATKLGTIQELQQAHEDISEHLQSLQDDYSRNRELLTESQEANTELETQLEASSEKVNRLQNQRNQIADALQYSERKNKKAQQDLEQSELTTKQLKQEHTKQQASLEASQQHIDSLKDSIDSKDQKINDVSSKINNLQSQLASSGQTSEKLREQLINQRKASDVAEHKRRELELNCQQAQAELSNKSGYVEHLQHEMTMLEQMSQQQKGDMEKQTQQLEQELKAKQERLSATENELSQARQISEQEKQESAAREAEFEKLQTELKDVEQRSQDQQQQIAETDAKWQAQQSALQAELKAKQEELHTTTEQLSNTQQQTEEEKAQHAALLKQLQIELEDVEQRAAEQDHKIAQSDNQWQEQQKALADELASKKAQLDTTQEQLNEHQRQVDAERMARKAQQDKLAQLKQEMTDVELRATKQREMMAGSDEQWREHHAEIEQQKQQLQQALEQAKSQNKAMQSTLTNKLEALKNAESTVSKTQLDEQKLQQELNSAKQQANELESKLAHQEEQEERLKQQVAEQQNSLQQREENIQTLQQEQQRLTESLRSVKEEYAQSKASLSHQNSSQEQLSEQLKALEDELKDSKTQLINKESALQDAQQQIASSADKLAQQEHALIDAQKEELKQVNEQQTLAEKPPLPEYASIPMPADATVWFDLLPYLQHRQGVTSLAATLQALIDSLQDSMITLDAAIESNNDGQIQISTRKLINLLESVHSAPLSDMANRLQMFCENRLIDNIVIFWPSAKQNLQLTLRVIYSHLHAEV